MSPRGGAGRTCAPPTPPTSFSSRSPAAGSSRSGAIARGRFAAVVTAIKQDEHLELTGALAGQTTGVLGIRLERREGGTLLCAELSTGGADAEASNGAKRALDDLFKARLKAFVEEGVRSGAAS